MNSDLPTLLLCPGNLPAMTAAVLQVEKPADESNGSCGNINIKKWKKEIGKGKFKFQ